jgi:GT2 family glycosyltransferase
MTSAEGTEITHGSATVSVTVVVLSYARPILLRRSLEALSRPMNCELEVLVVDNKSSLSDQIRTIAVEFPRVRFIGLDENRGFTGGMNEGLRQAKGEFILLTEDDMELESGAIEAWVNAHLNTGPSKVISSGVILESKSGALNFAGGDLQRDRYFELSLRREFPSNSTPFETQYMPGSLVFGRTADLRAAGGFRPDFFMYFEDVEFCLRASRLGYRLQIVPDARAIHSGSEVQYPACDGAPAHIQMHKIKNRLLTCQEHGTLMQCAKLVAWLTIRDVGCGYFLGEARAAWTAKALGWHWRRWWKTERDGAL